MYGLEDGRKQLAAYQRKSNDYIKTCLDMKTPNQVVSMYRGVMFWDNQGQRQKALSPGANYIIGWDVKVRQYFLAEIVSVKYSDTYANKRPSVKIWTGGRNVWTKQTR
jgi:hypothetical protein